MSEPTMIERVARAICKDAGWDFDTLPFGQADWTAEHFKRYGVDYTGMHQSDYFDAARAAIEALRLPTAEMCIAGYKAPVNQRGGHYDNQREAAVFQCDPMWRAMIDAALTPPEGRDA